METEPGLMGAVKPQKAAQPRKTLVSPHFLPSVQSIAIPVATGSSWSTGLDQTGAGWLLQ